MPKFPMPPVADALPAGAFTEIESRDDIFVGFDGGIPDTGALTSEAITVPAGGAWTTIVFPISEADLTDAGFGTVLGALTGADELRLFHNPDPFFIPGQIPAVSAVLGVDNIRAIGVSVPDAGGTARVLCVGLAALLTMGARRNLRDGHMPA